MDRSMPALRRADVFEAGRAALMGQYGARLQSHQQRAMAAITACRSGALGALGWHCPDCAVQRETPRSCGHRSCPACQNHSTTQWLERQRTKLLPADYFMITFTLPAGLRALAQARPRAVYAALFKAASQTVKGFGAHQLKAELGHYDATAGTVTFRYRNAKTRKAAYRTLPIADFLWQLLLHVLPTGLRRVRDYGFLHGKARMRLALVQHVLRVMTQTRTPPRRPAVCCPQCQSPMRIVAVRVGRRPDS